MVGKYTVNNLGKDEFKKGIQGIGFFSGAGGLDIGTQLAGVKVISSMDFDADSVATLKANNYFAHSRHLHADIRTLTASDYRDIITSNNPEKLILVGGPPCQPFSKAGYWVKNENRKANDDPRNMIGNYLRMVEELQPDGFLLENVESIFHPTNKIAVEMLQEDIDKLGYHLYLEKANALDYGAPQKRKRVFFIASKRKIQGVYVFKLIGTNA